MRKRPFHKLKGTKSSKPIKQGSKNSQINVRKAEIVARTQRGETAEQIAAALIAQGHELKKGASTITVRIVACNPHDVCMLSQK